MEELITLRKYIEEKDYIKALEIVGELEEMSKEDKLNKIYSYAVILLVHLIKQEAEKRTTRFWDVSINNSVRKIKRTNKRRNAVFARGNAGVSPAYSTLAAGVSPHSRTSPMSDCDKTRRKAGGCYASQDELIETIEEAFEAAIERAALEAFEGRYDGDELVQMIDVTKIKETALTLINC